MANEDTCERCGCEYCECEELEHIHDDCTCWVKLAPEANEIPLNKILMTWNGKSLSAPQVFRYRHMADQFRDEHKVTHFILIPDARKTI